MTLARMSYAQNIEIRPAATVQLPSATDSNSPAHWWNGSLTLFNSYGWPYRSQGADQFSLSGALGVGFGRNQPSPLWIEATWIDDDGTLFAWYHFEPGGICPGGHLTAPKIGAMVSYDNGYTFQDLGFVLESGNAVDCGAQNGYFAGGNGDFSVITDPDRNYFYFLFSNYGGDASTEGVAVARMDFNWRYFPRGSVQKFYNGSFSEPGIGGLVAPVFPAAVSWSSANTDAFWGPSIHWNTTLNQFVVLLNHSCCSPDWPQEGIYLSLIPDLSNPSGWTVPVKILDGGDWYPQVIGEDPGGTDKLAGPVSRLYMYGVSNWELVITGASPGPGPTGNTVLPKPRLP